MPRSIRWAAAASPTGPPPITATGRIPRRGRNAAGIAFILSPPFDHSGIFELKAKKISSRRADPPPRIGIGAAFVGEKAQKRVHRGIVRAADQRRRLPLLRDEPRSGSAGADDATASRRRCRSSAAPGRPAARPRPPAPVADRPAAASGCRALRAASRHVRALPSCPRLKLMWGRVNGISGIFEI